MIKLLEMLPSIGDYSAALREYSDDYICDAITSIADGGINTGWYDCCEFLRDNPDAVEDAISELGWDGCGGTIERAIWSAQFFTIEREIYNELEDAILWYILQYIIEDLDIDELPEGVYNEIEEQAANYDNNDRLDTIKDDIQKILIDNNIMEV